MHSKASLPLLFFLLYFQSLTVLSPLNAGPIQVGPVQAGPIQAGPILTEPLQTNAIIDSLDLSEVTAVSHDALGNLYITTADGVLMKLNKKLAVEQQHSSVYIPRLTSLEAAQMLKVFTFYQNSQQFQFFDRFLTPSPTNTIKTKSASHFSTATLSNDQMIWLYDDTYLQLIKYNPILEEVILKVDVQYFLPANAQVKALKEYGNRLYLWQNNELLVFDFLGNLIQKLPVDINNSFSFYENQLYYSEGTHVYGYDLNTMQQKKYSFPLAQEIRFVVRIESQFFLFTKDQLKVFEFEH